jgi:hypothetical protein
MKDRELLQKFHRTLEPGSNFGLELCKVALIDVLWGSQIDRRRSSIRYLQEGRLRLFAELSQGDLHGEFLLFYPDGKLWMRGAYRNRVLVPDAMRIFLPNGALAKPQPLPDNVVPMPQRSRL